MSQPRLRRPHQPWPLRVVFGAFEFCASLKLAVLLILGSAFVLGLATFIEGRYGLQAVQFGIYGTWWFAALSGLLALNIFCAAAIRYPWMRHQTGFVITHIGLLTLLLGCLLTRRGGIDAQMPILEGEQAHVAVEDTESLELVELPSGADAASEPRALATVPFRGGPFNWSDYAKFPWWQPLRYASIDRGVIYDHDSVRVEALDYYSNAEQVRAPRVELRMSAPRQSRTNRQGRQELGPQSWMPLTLDVREAGPDRPAGIGSREARGGGTVAFWLALTPAEVAAFLDSAPAAPIGPQGQIVLHAAGKKHTFNVEDLQDKGRVPLGDSGLEVELVRWAPSAERLFREDDFDAPPPQRPSPGVDLRLHRGEQSELMRLLADAPEINGPAREMGVYGALWYDQGKLTSEQLLAGEGNSRIDILQGPDGKLYYRYWNRKELKFAKELPTNGTKVPAFEMPMGTLEMYVKRHDFAPRPSLLELPLSFSPKQTPAGSLRVAKLRVTVDGNSEDIDLVGLPPSYDGDRPTSQDSRFVTGKGRRIALRLPLDRVETGFRVKLDNFERTLDPGTSQPATYSSVVDILPPGDSEQPLRKDVLITMNAPVDFVDPVSKRSYRLFQESFFGPITPDDPLYRSRFPHGDGPENWYASTLTVNYDPGRGLKYIGCLLIVAGIATMFYMRAYFFKPQPRGEASAAQAVPKLDKRKAELAKAR